jgi:hypothetical protein
MNNPAHLRHVFNPGIWCRLSLIEKIAVVQLAISGTALLLLVVLVMRK